MVLQRVGTGADVGLVALIAPGATAAADPGHAAPAMPQAAPSEPASELVAPAAEQPMPDYEQPAISGEAPAEFVLVDEFADEPPAEAVEAPHPAPAPEPVAPAAELPMSDYEQPANSGEARAEFALVDEFADEPPVETMEAPHAEPAPGPVAPARSSRCPTTSSRPVPARPRPSSP